MEITKKIINLVFKKLIGELSIMPLLSALAAFGICYVFVSAQQAAALALIVLAVIGLAEHMHGKAKSHFNQLSQKLNSLQGNDTETFVKLGDSVYGIRKWNSKFKDITVGGFIYRIITADRPVPLSAIAGPFCPECQKSLNYRPKPFFPWAIKYDCLCGFRAVRFVHPGLLYRRIRSHLNLPQ